MKINILQILILFLIIFHTDNNFAQTVTNNFIKSTTVLVPNITTTTQLNNLPNTSTRKQLSYFDGLGRPELSIIIQGSPNGYDIISSNIYDQLGRTDTQYMAYTANQNNGSYLSTNVANAQIKQFYNNPSDASIQATTAPYSIKVYENSPLSRVLTQTFPGQAWQAGNNGHPQSFFYSNNTNADSIKLWSVTYFNGAINGSACNEFYNAGQLYKTTTTDENNSMVIEYKDKTGLVVCKKTQDGANSYATTYYIYDDYNNLAYVLPPNISTINGFSEKDTNFNYYIYGYHYDNQRRLIEKKIPGKNGWDMMVYNKANQLVLNSNSQQRADGYWIFNKYDGLGRIIQIGKFIDNRSRVELQDYINTDMVYYERKNYNNKLGYTNTALPLITDTNLILVTNFYDNYDFLNNELLNAIGGASSFFNAPADVNIKANGAQGLLVFTKVQVLGSYINLGSGGTGGLNANSSTAQYLYSMNLYDRNGRVVKIVKTNYINGADIYDNSYNFVGELTTTKRTVYINNNFSSSNLVIQTNINYDRMGRKTGTKMIINNGSEVQTDSLEYNELGQLKTKRLHVKNDAGLEAINYAYNPRGWLTKAEGNYFKQKLYYDEIINNSTPQYNGNISVQTWGYNYSNQEKYYYDKLNRLTTYTNNNNNNNETISYADKIGNIAKIIRAGSINETIIFSYIGNKIKRANNFEYFYNENGSMLNNGNIIISGYNELNLPNNISKANASIFFTYNAKGEKVFKNEVGKEYRIYDDGLEFTRKNLTEPYVLDIIKFEEGYIKNATINYNFYYNLKDHVGNTRVSFMVNPNNIGNINQTIDYYAFGKVRLQGDTAIKYLFNGNEYQTGLDVYDFNARTYDPTTGRFLQVDPNIEDGEQLGFNPYHFSFNNPIRYNDPDGMEAEDWVQRKDGSIYWDNNANDQASTKAGETYLGKTLTFNFKSFIDKNLWDGPLGSLTAGEKLNSTITYTGIENEAGELTNISATKNSSPGPTLAGKARDYFPGLGNDQNKFGFSKNSNSLNLIFEQHASVSEFEEYGLNFMGYDIVNVAQQLDIKLTRNNLSISAGTDIFPSATLSMNGIELFKYNQPSFKGTHGRNYNFSDNGVGGVNIISTSRRTTPTIYNRFKN